jgi:prepilin-type N-terminal cleavage/methylation domain-containing protein
MKIVNCPPGGEAGKLKIVTNCKAFSLIELMIVMAIIGILSVVIIAGLTSSRSSTRLKSAQREVASVIRLAQSYALQGKTQNGITPCGYGFRFAGGNETDYEIFYNTPASGGVATCDALNGNPSGRQYIASGSLQAENYALKDSVRRSGGNPSAYELYFTVPHAKAYDTSGSEITASPIAIDLRIPGAGSKSITFFPGGRIVESP